MCTCTGNETIALECTSTVGSCLGTLNDLWFHMTGDWSVWKSFDPLLVETDDQVHGKHPRNVDIWTFVTELNFPGRLTTCLHE